MSYTAVPTEDPIADRNGRVLTVIEAGSPEGAAHRPKTIHSVTFWASVGVIVSSVISFVLFIGIFAANEPATTRFSGSEEVLRRPNPYVNLDELLSANGTRSFPPINNFPQSVFQIATSDKRRKLQEDNRHEKTQIGTVYSEDRHVLVNSETSTVIQFRNLDYAMERCVLRIPPLQLKDPTSIDIWVLDSLKELSKQINPTLEYAPPRREMLTSLSVSSTNTSSSSEFHCPSFHFTTLELTCSASTPKCNVDFWQNRRTRPIVGIHIVQYFSRAT